ncbi:MAG: RNA-guided pseudouridylation complex pseudouridine synthase subunit Cbf5, partial [Candidatus Freyarchaeota archaeon]
MCHDIGEVLGCGAHMRELRRIGSGPFTEENIVT